jgi:hypothetical protein
MAASAFYNSGFSIRIADIRSTPSALNGVKISEWRTYELLRNSALDSVASVDLRPHRV